MKLSEYYKMLNQVDGIKSNTEPDPRISIKDLSFDEGPGKNGSATITYLDGEPVYVNWYNWDLNEQWMWSQIEEEIKSPFEIFNLHTNNAHGGAEIIKK